MGSRFDGGGFRDVDASDAPLAYSAHLDRALTYAPIVENRRLVRESLALTPGQVVLDVGSGNGEEVREIASVVGEGGRAVGIDLSATLVDEARSRTPAAATNIEFVVGDAQTLPFEDGTFDAVRSERTLQHVDDPALVVSEMARVTRTGGRVAVTEPDWGLLFIAASDQETSARVCERVVTGSRNPRIGRNLALLFGQSGLMAISAAARVGLWTTLAAAEERFGLAAMLEDLVAAEALEEDRAERWLASLHAQDTAGTFLAGVCSFIVSGQKP